MDVPRTIPELLSGGDSTSLAIGSVDGARLTYGELLSVIARFKEALNAFGIGRNDAVCIMLPGGPEMAIAFLGVASCAIAAPLNPAYRKEEFEFYLSDLQARAFI